MIYLFKAPPNGTPTFDTRSVRKNTSKNHLPNYITSHHILPRKQFPSGDALLVQIASEQSSMRGKYSNIQKGISKAQKLDATWMAVPCSPRRRLGCPELRGLQGGHGCRGSIGRSAYRRQLLRTGRKDLKQQSQLRYEGQGVQDSNGHEANNFRINAKTWCNQQAS